jgi:hypothetical protein
MVEGGVVTERFDTQFLGFREKSLLPLPSTDAQGMLFQRGV